MDNSVDNISGDPIHKRELTDEQRQIIFETLLKQSRDGKLKRGCITSLAKTFSVSVQTISRIWKRGKTCTLLGLAVNVSNKKPKTVGRKRVQIEPQRVAAIPLRRRTNIRSISGALKVSKSTLHRRIKEGLAKAHSNAMRPLISEEGKKARLRFCLSMIEPLSLESQPTFKNMYDYVHIDEKWFYMSKETQRYYLIPGEDEPFRTCQSKRFMTKVMFLVAVARPRFDVNGVEVFSGKIGIWPFTCKEPAKRKSKNREAGTLETKAILVTKDVIRSCLIEKVLPAIRSKWPHSDVTRPIYIQQDNAKPHINALDAEFLEAATKDGFDIRISNQPPNSPDLNVLDLGFFNSIQSLQHQEAPANIDELVNAVEKSFENVTSDNLNRVFLSLQACMIEVMKVNGGINYKLPHIGKSQMLRDDNNFSSLHCDRHILENALSRLQE